MKKLFVVFAFMATIVGCQKSGDTMLVNTKWQSDDYTMINMIWGYSYHVYEFYSEDSASSYWLDKNGNIADSEGSLLENLSMEVVVEEDPEYIFVTTMGSSSEALAALSQNIKSNPAWKSLTAVKEGRYYELDPELFHEKPNERWAESYARLAQILYGYEVDNA